MLVALKTFRMASPRGGVLTLREGQDLTAKADSLGWNVDDLKGRGCAAEVPDGMSVRTYLRSLQAKAEAEALEKEAAAKKALAEEKLAEFKPVEKDDEEKPAEPPTQRRRGGRRGGSVEE